MFDDEKCLCGSGRMYSICCKPFSGLGIEGYKKEIHSKNYIKAYYIAVAMLSDYLENVKKYTNRTLKENAIIIYTNKVILKKSPFGTYKRWGWCFVVFLIIYFILESININIKSYVSLTLFAIPVAIIIVILYIVGMFIFERKSLLYLLEILKNKLRIK